ncbi:Sodium/hydrogen exchanger [Karstenula rhodostoma CBS 690.94]|uniref:Sodium/hydrogen exchanger n=1 Tax=Karstenula rhodostoma CBS 690.94 TaxID=1392251 RepID=A0A9P4PIA1_9PLEO|nr:Sodium/hydrogen exchanger [Karstenula rhodostoma CBS 690.94]
MAAPFLQYHEPGIIDILILVSFFTFLWISEYASNKIIRAGIIGPIAVGIIYGQPLANILHHDWQETFLYLGYIGLVLIIFEGGLSTRLDLLKANFGLSLIAAATGVLCPIGFSYLLLYLGFGYGAVETFIIGAALSATSLGTTFAVIAGASKSVDLSQTRVGAVLISAAVMDDVSGLVMSSVIHQLGTLSSGGDANLGWLIGRPIVASAAMAILTPVLTKWVFAPLFRSWVEHHFAKLDHLSNISLMIVVLCAFISIASFAGTSILFGAFLAGTFLTYLPSKHPSGPFVVLSREQGEREKDKSPTFVHTFELYCFDAQTYVLAPLFFASIGFAIPFLDLWSGRAIWRGAVYTLLMLVAKFLVGVCIPISSAVTRAPASGSSECAGVQEKSALSRSVRSAALPPALLLGMAMVARGEIGLLIVEIGYNNTSYVSADGFITAIWAILLNTIIGPIAVGLLVKLRGEQIAKGAWGLVPGPEPELSAGSDAALTEARMEEARK